MSYTAIQIDQLRSANTMNDSDLFVIQTGTGSASQVTKSIAFNDLTEQITQTILDSLTPYTEDNLVSNFADGATVEIKPYSAKCIHDAVVDLVDGCVQTSTFDETVSDLEDVDADLESRIETLETATQPSNSMYINAQPTSTYTYSSAKSLTTAEQTAYEDQLEDSSMKVAKSGGIVIHRCTNDCTLVISGVIAKYSAILLVNKSSYATKSDVYAAVSSNRLPAMGAGAVPVHFSSLNNMYLNQVIIPVKASADSPTYVVITPTTMTTKAKIYAQTWGTKADPFPYDTTFKVFEYCPNCCDGDDCGDTTSAVEFDDQTDRLTDPDSTGGFIEDDFC